MSEPRSDLVCIHGYTASWRNWGPVVGGLEQQHDVHVARLAGHVDGPTLPLHASPSASSLADQLERDLDRAGIGQAHLVGNSLGGWLALELASRGRALSVTALAPALGWEPTGPHIRSLSRRLSIGRQLSLRGAPVLPWAFRSATVRRAALKIAVAHGDRMSPEEALAFVSDLGRCTIWRPLKQWLLTTQHELGPVDCPVQIVHSSKDALIPHDPYAARFPTLVPRAEFSVLEDVGHVPMYDDPGLVTRTVLEFTRAIDDRAGQPL